MNRLKLFLAWGMWSAVILQAEGAISTTVDPWERRGIVALLLAAVVVLWRRGETDRQESTKLIEKMVRHEAVLSELVQGLRELTTAQQQTSQALTDVMRALHGERRDPE